MTNFAERQRFTELSDTVYRLLREDGYRRVKSVTGIRTYHNPRQNMYLEVEPNARLRIDRDEFGGTPAETRGTYVTFMLEGKVDDSLTELGYRSLLKNFKDEANARLQSYGVKVAGISYPGLNGRKELRASRILLEYNTNIKPLNVILAIQEVKNMFYGTFSKYIK